MTGTGFSVTTDVERRAVQVRGELDQVTAPLLLAAIHGVDGHDRGDVTVDLSGVTFIDSRALVTLVRAHRELAVENRMLRVANARRSVAKVMEVTGITDYLERGERRDGG